MKNIIFTICLFPIVSGFAQVPSYVPTNGLVGYWPFNGNANDESGNGNVGTVNGATLISDRFGNANQAYSFDGIDDWIEVADNNSLDLVGSMSMTYWLNTATPSFNPSRMILDKSIYNTSNGWNSPVGAPGQISVLVGNNTGTPFLSTNNAITASNWHFVAVTYDLTSVRMYIDGVLNASFPHSGMTTSTTNSLKIAAGGTMIYYYQGIIDDIGLWDRAITECEIQDLYNAQLNSAAGILAGPDLTVCQGESVTLSGSGGTNYSWDNSVQDGQNFVPANTVTYTLTGTSQNGCLGSDQVLVTVNPLPSVNAGPDQTICKGDSIVLTGSGANNYQWDNTVVDGIPYYPTSTAVYNLIGTDNNNCTGTDQVIITVNNPSFSYQNETVLDSYNWPVNGQTYTQSGTYEEVLTNSVGCDSTIILYLTVNFTGINEHSAAVTTIYPNPTNDLLYIVMPTESMENYIVIDNRGRKILEGMLNGTETQISLKELTTGSYILQVGRERLPLRVIKQ